MSENSKRGIGKRLLHGLSAPLRGLRAIVRYPRNSLPVFASAAMVVFAFPPFDIAPLAFVCMVPLLSVAIRVKPREAFLWGWLAGFLLTAVGFHFMVTLFTSFGGMPLIAAVLLHAIFSIFQGLTPAFFAWFVARIGVRLSLYLVVPLAYVAAEMICRQLFIFPWYLSNSTYTVLPFVQAADLFGGFGLTFVVVLVNVAVFDLGRTFLRKRAGQAVTWPRLGPALAAGMLLAALLYGVVRIAQVESVMEEQPTFRVGLVEADIGIYSKAEPELVANNLLIHQTMSAQLAAMGADLIVWPESSANPFGWVASQEDTDDLAVLNDSLWRYGRLPRDVTYLRPSSVELVEDVTVDSRNRTPFAERVGIQRGFEVPLLFGAITAREATPEEMEGRPIHPRLAETPNLMLYNTAILLDAQGRVLGTYDKNVLLLFGEYVPFAGLLYQWFGFNFFEFVPSSNDISPGETASVMELTVPREDGSQLQVRLGALICYEDIIAGYGLRMAELEPNVFVNIINDAWFGQSSAAYHHNAFAVFRAIEHRIPLVRATNTGVSTFIDPVGRVTRETRLTERETLIEDVVVMPPPTTLYSKVGDIVGWLCLLGSLALVVVSWRRKWTVGGPSDGQAAEGSVPTPQDGAEPQSVADRSGSGAVAEPARRTSASSKPKQRKEKGKRGKGKRGKRR